MRSNQSSPMSKAQLKKRDIEFIMYSQDVQLEPQYQKLISDVLYKLPDDAIKKFFEVEPQFIVLEKGDIGVSHCIQRIRMTSKREKSPKKYDIFDGQTWLIILNEEQLVKLSIEQQQAVIAEELAHTFLGHVIGEIDLNNFTNDYRKDSKAEREAAVLMKSWGFKYLSSQQLKSGMRKVVKRTK